jgi:heme/copper-type cytochrome/quinol oxidase subunit 3
MSELVSDATDYEIVEGEPPELLGRNLNSASHLLASASAFFFVAFVFAYFYLRSLDNAHLWKPKGVTPSQTFGAVVVALTLASALLVHSGLRARRRERRNDWRIRGGAALAAGIAALVVQVVEWTSLGFGPADGGYASVFFGWTAFQLLFAAGALFWLETILATSLRYRDTLTGTPAPGEASGDPGRPGHDVSDPLSLVLPELEAVSFLWSFLAGLAVLAWVILYLA